MAKKKKNETNCLAVDSLASLLDALRHVHAAHTLGSVVSRFESNTWSDNSGVDVYAVSGDARDVFREASDRVYQSIRADVQELERLHALEPHSRKRRKKRTLAEKLHLLGSKGSRDVPLFLLFVDVARAARELDKLPTDEQRASLAAALFALDVSLDL